jgi:PAS domain S-box-containing protein
MAAKGKETKARGAGQSAGRRRRRSAPGGKHRTDPEVITQQLLTLFRVSTELQRTPELGEQLNLIAQAIVDAKTYRRAIISLFDEEWRVIRVGYAGLTEPDVRVHQSRPPLSPEQRTRIFRPEYRVSRSYYVPHTSELAQEISEDAVQSHLKQEDFVDWDPKDLLFVPLTSSDGKTIGSLSVDDPFDGRRPTEESLQIIELFANMAAEIVERSRLHEALYRTTRYLETLIRSCVDIIVATDADGMITLINKGAEEVFGYKEEEVLGKPASIFYESEEEVHQVMKELQGPDHGGVGILRDYDTTGVSKSGERIPLSLSVSILYDEEGNEIGTAGISKDLREIKKLERELIRAEKLATFADVAATLSHEINNFLEGIISAGQLSLASLEREDIVKMYEEKGLAEERREKVEQLSVINEEALRIGAITERLQLMAKTGTLKTKPYLDKITMVDIDETCVSEDGERYKILVADDRLYVRRFLAQYLGSKGHEVDTAADGQETIDKAKEHHYDLVLSDIKMPKKNGYEVFSEIKEERPETEVILMTAYGYDPTHALVKSSKEGLRAVLYKPFDMKKIDTTIARAMAARACEKEPG